MLALLLGCVARGPVVPESVEPPAHVLEAVVLLIGVKPSGTETGYGAGVLVGEGLVLTNLHVVDELSNLQAMLHDAERKTYIPTDGGLFRTAFEDPEGLVGARLVRGSPRADLALVRLAGDPGVAPPPWVEAPPAIGEEVYAMGHPRGIPWSFTAGVVSALHEGFVQHDAAVTMGNSGGPLVDGQGRVIGINTLELRDERTGGAVAGIGFARPVSLAGELMDQGAVELDLSNPEAAWTSCQRAYELGSPAYLDCLPAHHEVELMEALQAGMIAWHREHTPEQAEAAEAHIREWLSPVAMAENGRHCIEQDLAGLEGKERVLELLEWREGHPRAEEDPWNRLALDTQARSDEAFELLFSERTGARLPRGCTTRGRLQLGVRVTDLRYVGDDVAWLHVTGRNPDGTTYAYAAPMVLEDGAWYERRPAPPELEATRPEGFPLTVYDLPLYLEVELGSYAFYTRESARLAASLRDQQQEQPAESE